MTLDLAAIKAACEAATPAPWAANVWIETDGNEWRATGPGHEDQSHDHGSEPGCPDEQAAQADARFIALARQALPECVAEIERLTSERDCARWADETRQKAGLALIADRDEWRTQHENALACWDVDRRNLAAKIAATESRLVDALTERDSALQSLKQQDSDLATMTARAAAAEASLAETKRHLDARIQWQAEAVLNLQTFRALFDTACLMREGHEGCVTDPACGSCFRCDFDRAVDQAKVEVAAGVDEFIQESIGFWGRFAAQMQKERDEARRQRDALKPQSTPTGA